MKEIAASNLPSTSAFSKALNAWKAILGENAVVTNRVSLNKYEKGTYSTNQKIKAVLLPNSSEQVQLCVKIAHQFKQPIYPISKGKNWGYGSTIPVQDQNVLLYLKGLNNISEYYDKRGVVTVEPGVSFAQLNQFLLNQRAPYCFPPPSSTNQASILGNLLERGTTPGKGDGKEGHLLSLAVLLADGTIIQIGNRVNDLPADAMAGPALISLFSQSNFGIILKAKVKLIRIPAHRRMLTFTIQDQIDPIKIFEALAQLKTEKLLSPSVILYNNYKLMTMERQYPFALTKGERPLPKKIMEHYIQAKKGLQWLVVTNIASENQSWFEAKFQLIDDFIKKHQLMASWWNYNDPANPFYTQLATKDSQLLYWRKSMPIPTLPDPIRDNCGLVWCNALIAYSQLDVLLKNRQKIEALILKHGFEPGITLRMVTSDYVHCLIAIIFDRSVEGENEKALVCQQAVNQYLIELGLAPYRLGIHQMAALTTFRSSAYLDLVKKIKHCLDPNQIIAPERYEES